MDENGATEKSTVKYLPTINLYERTDASPSCRRIENAPETPQTSHHRNVWTCFFFCGLVCFTYRAHNRHFYCQTEDRREFFFYLLIKWPNLDFSFLPDWWAIFWMAIERWKILKIIFHILKRERCFQSGFAMVWALESYDFICLEHCLCFRNLSRCACTAWCALNRPIAPPMTNYHHAERIHKFNFWPLTDGKIV